MKILRWYTENGPFKIHIFFKSLIYLFFFTFIVTSILEQIRFIYN